MRKIMVVSHTHRDTTQSIVPLPAMDSKVYKSNARAPGWMKILPSEIYQRPIPTVEASDISSTSHFV